MKIDTFKQFIIVHFNDLLIIFPFELSLICFHFVSMAAYITLEKSVQKRWVCWSKNLIR